MRDSTKTTLKNVFGSLVNNQRAIDGAKNNPWWIAIVMFILGIFLPVIPMMVQSGKTYGSSFIDGSINGYEVTMTTASEKLKADGYEFVVEGNHKLAAYKNNTPVEVDYVLDTEGQKTAVELPIYQYINTENSQIDLQVYWSPRANYSAVTSLIEALNNQKYQTGTSVLGLVTDDESTTDVDEAATATYYAPSYTILYPDGLITVLKKANSTEILTNSYMGNNWNHIDEGTKVLERVLNVDLPDEDKTVTNKAYNAAVLDNWSNIYDVAYKDQKKNKSTSPSKTVRVKRMNTPKNILNLLLFDMKFYLFLEIRHLNIMKDIKQKT